MRRLLFVTGLATVVASCGTDPTAILTISMNAFPEFTSETGVDLSGTVTRDPPDDKPIIVTVAGGTNIVTDTTDGAFQFRVNLNRNRENQLAITAHDQTGAISQAFIATVFHDDTGPLAESSIPSNRAENVPLDTPIELRFAERLVATSASATFRLKQNSRVVPGVATLSGDSTLFTFQPSDPLEPHSIYEMTAPGFGDAAGNPALNGGSVCFITNADGLVTEVSTDTSTSTFSGGTPNQLTTPDLVGASLARVGNTLYGLFEFTADRSLTGPTDRAAVFLDIDIDNNGSTGFLGLKDFLLDTNFPELNSGMGTEFVVSLDGHAVADSGFVGVNVGDAEWNVIDTFLPGVCGRFFGFDTDALLASDDGNFDYVYSAFAVEDTTAQAAVFLDPVPIEGHFTAALTTPGPARLQRSAPADLLRSTGRRIELPARVLRRSRQP